MIKFKEGQLVAYCPKDSEGDIYKVELGCFKKLNKSKTAAFVHFHMGNTAASVPLNDVYPIHNESYIVNKIGWTFNSLDQEAEI